MSKHTEHARVDAESNDVQRKNRRDFLKSLGKWSTIIIGGIALGGVVAPDDAAGWLNGGGEVGLTHEAAVGVGSTGLVVVAGVGSTGLVVVAGAGSTGREAAAVRGLTVEAIDRVGCLLRRKDKECT